jgi:hypothetical protein
MTKALRLVLLPGSALVALAVAGSALGAYQPRLIVKNPSERLGAATPFTIRVEQPKEDDATARVVIYVPRAYTVSLVPQDGATVGRVAAQAQAAALGPDVLLPLEGEIKGDPTYTAAEYPTGTGCLASTGITVPEAVYRLELAAAGQTIMIPVYASAITSGPLASSFSAQFVACLSSPYVPEEQGGARLGAKVINTDLTVSGIFTNPAVAGDHRWSAIWTPYAVGTSTANAAGTVETQSVDRLAARLTLRAQVRGRSVTLSGSLLENGSAVPRARVQLLLGRTAARVRGAGTATTNGRGGFTATLRNRARGTWFARARVTVGERAAPCQTLFAPIPCISANVGGFSVVSNQVIRFRIR